MSQEFFKSVKSTDIPEATEETPILKEEPFCVINKRKIILIFCLLFLKVGAAMGIAGAMLKYHSRKFDLVPNPSYDPNYPDYPSGGDGNDPFLEVNVTYPPITPEQSGLLFGGISIVFVATVLACLIDRIDRCLSDSVNVNNHNMRPQ